MDRQHRSLKTDELLISSLVARCQKGDTEAFSRLYDIFFDPLYRYLYYRANGDGVDDLLETIFLKVWMNLLKYRPQESPFSAWVFRIAHNVLVDFYRSRRNQNIGALPEDHADDRRDYSSTHLIKIKLERESLRKALKKLKPDYQQVIILKFINELENSEIAEILGKNENSLRIMQFRALRSLRKALEAMGVTDYEQ